jgi:hypothetical protein
MLSSLCPANQETDNVYDIHSLCSVWRDLVLWVFFLFWSDGLWFKIGLPLLAK